MNVPLVRTPDGVILGIDYRRVPELGWIHVPDTIPAVFVEPGDTIRIDGADLLVLARNQHDAGITVITVRDIDGERFMKGVYSSEPIEVIAAGAFDE